MRRGRRTLVGNQVRPVGPASSPAASCASPLSHSPSPLAVRSSDPRHRSPLPPALGASFSGSSGLLPQILGHQRLRLALPQPARTQSPSVSLARPLELIGASQSSGDLSARVVLPLLSTIACVFKRVSSASTSRTVSCRWIAFYHSEMAEPR